MIVIGFGGYKMERSFMKAEILPVLWGVPVNFGMPPFCINNLFIFNHLKQQKIGQITLTSVIHTLEVILMFAKI